MPDNEYRERVYWTGPKRHHKCDDCLKCNYQPYCQDIVEAEVETEPLYIDRGLLDIEVDCEDSDSTAW